MSERYKMFTACYDLTNLRFCGGDVSTGSCNLIISIEKLQCCHAGAHRRARPDRRPGHEPALPACPDVHVDAPAVVATAITAGRPTSRSRTWAGRAARARRPIRTAHPPRLPLPDHVHGLVSLDRSPRRVECTKALLRHCHLGERPGVSQPPALAPQPPRVDRTEPLAPRPNRLGGDRHASLREAIFGSADAAAEPMGEPDRVADDVGRESRVVIAGRRAPHRPTLPLVAST